MGPVADIGIYGAESLPIDLNDEAERVLRSPLYFLHIIANPTFVIEGTAGNIGVFSWFRRAAQAAPVRLASVFRSHHFNILAPVSRLVAQKILSDKSAAGQSAIDESAIDNIAIDNIVINDLNHQSDR